MGLWKLLTQVSNDAALREQREIINKVDKRHEEKGRPGPEALTKRQPRR